VGPNAVRSVFRLFLFIARKARKTRVFFLISALPVLVAVVVQAGRIFTPGLETRDLAVFSNVIMGFNLQFLILVLSLFYGTSVCSEELEGKTLTYLTTRPASKTAVIVGKYSAYVVSLTAIVAVNVIAAFVILNFHRASDLSAWLAMLRGLGVLVLGILAYTAFFTLVGTFLKKSILFGLFFGFGWENVVQYFPGSTQKFTIMHYLKSLLPAGSTGGGRLSFLMFRLEPSPPGAAVAMLLFLTALFLSLACLVFSKKEYIFED